jgi:hypothetical protein
MNDNEILEITRTVIECITSLNDATNCAGGIRFTADELDRMTAMQLISMLAPNRIQFVYKRKE